MANTVSFKQKTTVNISNEGVIGFQSEKPCVLDSIWLVNTTEDNVFVDLRVITERTVSDGIEVSEGYLTKSQFLDDYQRKEILKGSILYLEPQDLLYVATDFSAKNIDCLVSYREVVDNPFVKFRLKVTPNIDSTSLPIMLSDKTCILDTVWLTNTLDRNIFADLKTMREISTDNGDEILEGSFAKNYLLENFASKDLLKDSLLHLEPIDQFYANSDFSSNVFDALVSYRELI